MEELRNSRRPAKPSYSDVFGGPPKFSAAKSSDYAEIFGGGVASSCSIPFLDLPAPRDSDDDGGLINYYEIFGGFKAGDFAADYEELFSKKTVKSVQTEAKHIQPVGASYLSPEGVTNRENGASSEENKFSSSSNHSDDGSKQFNVSYHWTSRGSMEDVITGKKDITQLHAVPGSTYQINSCSSLQNGRNNNSSDIQANDLINNASSNGQLNDAGQEKIASLLSSGDNLRSYVSDLKSNGKEFSTNHNASEDGPMHMKHHSRSSSNYSASSGDIPCPDVSYVSISDISLRTKPSRMPPPSRAPPKLISKQEHTKVKMNSRGDRGEGSLKSAWTQQIHYSIGSAKSHGLQGAVKDSSSGFLDVEVDASSALAASAAAMKEAMKQAQARLKSAKELMDRKRDNLPVRKKVGHKESAKFDESNGVRDFEEEKMLSELTANKLLQKDDNEIKEHTLDYVQKTIKVGKAAPYDEWQGNGFKPSQICNKSEEITGEWRTEKQFYELINNGKRFGIVKEAFMQEDFEKKPNAASKVSENEVNYSETAELDCDFNGAVKGYKVSEAFERDEINDNSKSYNVIHKEEIVAKAEKIPEICMLKESKSEASHGCHYQNGKKKSQTAPETLFSREERNKPYSGKEATCAENEMNVESSNSYPEFEEVYHDDEENRKEKHSSEPYVTFMPYEREKKLEGFGGTGVQPENDIKVTTAACVMEAGEIGLEVAYLYENPENTRGNDKVESYIEENECPLEDAAPISAHEESIMNGSHGACMMAENDFIDQDGNEAQKNFEELKSAPDIGELKVTEEKTNSPKESCWPDYNSMETRDTHQEYQQNSKKQDVEQPPSVVKNTGEPVVSVDGDSEDKNGKFKEGSEASKDRDNKFDATEATFQRCENMDMEDTEKVSKSDNEDLEDSSQEICQNLSSSHVAKETLGTAEAENLNHDVRKREELECEKIIEEEDSDLGKVQARKVEEEKEREREREKDRLAIERATREAHERASRERAERIAVERATAEARQRALTEAREKAEKAAAEALEKSLVEKALKEAKLRAERAAVERATAEARERAVEKALADKAAADARQRLNNISRGMGRKESEAGEYSIASDKDNREVKVKTTSSDVLNNQRFQSAGLPGSSQRHADSSAHDEVESPLRCKARLERHQRTVERAAKALAEKNMRDILVQREQTERNRLAETLDADVRRWSTGKEGNLRALLSTLQYILGPESGWQPIPLTEVITAVAVKKAYRKATLYVHPDKLQQRGASIQQKYICEKVFDLLKEAWNRFNSEER